MLLKFWLLKLTAKEYQIIPTTKGILSEMMVSSTKITRNTWMVAMSRSTRMMQTAM